MMQNVMQQPQRMNNGRTPKVARHLIFSFSLISGWLIALNGYAQTSQEDFPETPKIAAASDEGQKAIQSFVYPEGLQVQLFAAEPDVANPVAIHVDYRGNVFVCESYRQGKGIEDNRKHANWLNDDLAAQTVADRVAYIKKFLGDKAIEYTRYDDRIRLLKDVDQDGKADSSQVFANRFNKIESGTGAGVLSYRNKVFYTCIPDLWLIQDKNQDGISDTRQALHTGYGVRFAFRGHDSHGLIVGPDGRLYFSIGDRGYNIRTEGKNFKDPASGAIFRCDLDGKNFEVVATGLRNPQELAFDDFGNLFTGDNNSDSGDKARWVYVVPGSDSGWRMYYQYLPDRGPFNREKIWHPFSKESPAYIVPPVTNLADGPSGLAYYPGTGLGDQFKGRFFLCDFRGGPANSGIRTFRVKQQGAFFEVTDMEQSFWRQLVTDLHFGPDGSLFVADWVNGWEGLGKGRIYRYTNPVAQKNMAVAEVKKLLSEGMRSTPEKQLADLLASADQRVRQEAQFELVARKKSGTLISIALDESKPTLPRIHAIWGVEQMTRNDSDKSHVDSLLPLLESADPEVRAQTARFIGDCGATEFASTLAARLLDENLRVRYFALNSLGKQRLTSRFSGDQAAQAIFRTLDENGDDDPIVRHGAIMALVGLDSNIIWEAALKSNSRFVQKAAVVALRKLKNTDRQVEWIGKYLSDDYVNRLEEEVLVEIVRAVHDLPIKELYPRIARLALRPKLSDPILRRALNAGYRLGAKDHAQTIARLAGDRSASETVRFEALHMLKTWANPSGRDLVLGDWRPLGARSAEPAAQAFRSNLASILSGSTKLTREAITTSAKLGVKEVLPTVRRLFEERTNDGNVRADALRALNAIEYGQVEPIAVEALSDGSAEVRIAAMEVLSKVRPKTAVTHLAKAMNSGVLKERQAVFGILGTMKQKQTNEIVESAMNRLIKGEVPKDTQLDVLLAARRINSPKLKRLLERHQSLKTADDPLSEYLECQEGGDAMDGERIFFEKTSVYCMRCHKVGSRGGEVGPDLSRIGKEKDRKYLLEAIVNPNGAIAKGYETVLVGTDDGLTYSGIIKSESDQEIVLITPEGKTTRIEKERIEQLGKGKSSMPADLIKNLSPSEIRNLVEYLSSLQGQAPD